MADRKSAEQFIVRFPDGMRDRIRAAAEANGRSMNAEIVQTLERAYPRNPDIDATAAEIVRLADALAREEDKEKRAELFEQLRDMNTVLQHELHELMGGPVENPEDDHLKYL